jgi:hypothetical protein
VLLSRYGADTPAVTAQDTLAGAAKSDVAQLLILTARNVRTKSAWNAVLFAVSGLVAISGTVLPSVSCGGSDDDGPQSTWPSDWPPMRR